jgi:hypothetical protein
MDNGVKIELCSFGGRYVKKGKAKAKAKNYSILSVMKDAAE